MKTRNSMLLKAAAAITLSVVSLPMALFALVGFIVAPALGASYNKVNAMTKTDLTTQNSKAAEELWSRQVVLGADAIYMENPLSGDGFSAMNDLGKAIVRTRDTEKVAGTTINIPTYGGFGGPGSQGSSDRIGNEQKMIMGNFQCKIGRFWFGIGYNAVARDETMIGGKLDPMIKEGLRQLHAKKRNDDMLRLLIENAAGSTRNSMVIEATSYATLKSANNVDTVAITQGRNRMSSLGGMPMALGPADSAGSRPESFVWFSTQHGLYGLDFEDAYLLALRHARERGVNNPLFKGNYVDWNGMGIYRWLQKDHGNNGPIGSLLAPRMYLAADLPTLTYGGGNTWANSVAFTNTYTAQAGDSGTTGGGTGVLITGGYGLNQSVFGPTVSAAFPDYTSYFSGAPWTYHWGDTIAADTSAQYVMIIGQSGTNKGKFGIFKYTVNTGKHLVLTQNVYLAGPPATQSTDGQFKAGDLVVQCNVLGTTTGKSIVLGQQAILAGMGSINGSTSNPQMGRRTEEHRNHDLDHAIGAECVWGAAIIKRADNVAPGSIVVDHAIQVDGAPTIT